MTWKQLLQKHKTYRISRGWDKQDPGDLAKSVVIEASEILEHFQWDMESLRLGKKDYDEVRSNKKISEISDEIGDV